MAAATLAGDGPLVVRFDHDRLYDYRMVRPTVQFDDGVISGLEWPELSIRLASFDERDVLVLSGTEPNWNWEALSEAVVEICTSFGVAEYFGIGGVPWATPHTRPITLMSTASSADLLPADSGAPEGRLQVPAAAVSVIEWAVSRAGIGAAGLWARVPNYVGGDYPAAAVALLDALSKRLGLVLETGDLEERANTRREELDAVASQRPEVQGIITQLEELHDSTQPVSGDDLAAEIERFLRDQ